VASTRGCQQTKGGGTQSGFVNVDVADSTCSPASFDGTISPVGGQNRGIVFGNEGALISRETQYLLAGVIAFGALMWAAISRKRKA
jgi:hypothetical protein